MDKIRELKEKHIFSEKILKKIFDKGKGDWYDSSTGRNPLYEIRGSDWSPESMVQSRSIGHRLERSRDVLIAYRPRRKIR